MSESSTWSGDDTVGYANDTGFRIVFIDGYWCLASEELDAEGVDFYIPLVDLFSNPKTSLVITGDDGKIPATLIPNIVIGETFFAGSLEEMLSLNVQKGDVCIRTDIPGGVTFRLMGTDPTNFTHWAELRARYINWTDIQNKPNSFPPSQHTHSEYAGLNAYGKLPADLVDQLYIGNNFVARNETEMINLPASQGDVCTRLDLEQSYILAGLAYEIDDWIPIVTPSSKVDSVNGKRGIVTLTAKDIGYPEKIKVFNSEGEIAFSEVEKNLFVTFDNGENFRQLAFADDIRTIKTAE
ncbi:MAG: hypothetical protein KDK36_02150, partial [Leptospiraceae bacterium]|nr:hypothetical protein [Leptospiraceae bacterium]